MDVKIEKLVYGGEGLGHQDGATVFVPYVLPEEVVRIRPLGRTKKLVRGRVEEWVSASPERTSPPCPHFGVCGGCHYQHIPYAAQLRYKTEILRETLRRIGRIEWDQPIESVASPPLGYRNRAQWRLRPASGGSPARIGYHQASSSELCAVEGCPILSPRLGATLATLREQLEKKALPPTVTQIEGGVELTVERNVTSIHKPYRKFTKGLNHMDGAEALDWIRQRKQFPDGDFARMRHQQEFLKALLDKAASSGTLTNPAKLNAFLKSVTAAVTVDEGFSLIDMAVQFRSLRGDNLQFFTSPNKGSDTIDGESVVVSDREPALAMYQAMATDKMAQWMQANQASPSPATN